eukprot:766756-Hanusia_phi.AAC.2
MSLPHPATTDTVPYPPVSVPENPHRNCGGMRPMRGEQGDGGGAGGGGSAESGKGGRERIGKTLRV